MKSRVYVETTVISYLTAWRSPQLAKALIEKTPLPKSAGVDALHIAVATLNGMDYLLTWNCRHIANATIRNDLAATCESAGYKMPIICTPLELIEETST